MHAEYNYIIEWGVLIDLINISETSGGRPRGTQYERRFPCQKSFTKINAKLIKCIDYVFCHGNTVKKNRFEALWKIFII